jgi:hypothetical protein
MARSLALLGVPLALALAPAAAHAERQTIVNVSAGLSALGPLDAPDGGDGPEDVGLQLRGIVSFEEAPLPYREPRGYMFAGTLVPEIFVGMLAVGDERTEMVGGGLRAELAFSQRRMGLLEVSARGGMYVAARAGLFTDPDHTRLFEGALGEYFLIGDNARIGFELGIMGIYAERYDYALEDGVLLGPPFEQGRGTYLNVNAAVSLGVTL